MGKLDLHTWMGMSTQPRKSSWFPDRADWAICLKNLPNPLTPLTSLSLLTASSTEYSSSWSLSDIRYNHHTVSECTFCDRTSVDLIIGKSNDGIGRDNEIQQKKTVHQIKLMSDERIKLPKPSSTGRRVQCPTWTRAYLQCYAVFLFFFCIVAMINWWRPDH